MNELRFSKQIKLKGFGIAGQQAHQNGKLPIADAGGLGTRYAQYLNSMGVGAIGLADEDTIALSNLPGQTLFDKAETGPKKVAVLSKKRSLQNPSTNIICHDTFLTPQNAQGTMCLACRAVYLRINNYVKCTLLLLSLFRCFSW
ncbi:MAG: sulfurtransferase [Ferruginibacter sp.]|uniref:ThiF family adenylyltransferase n=1 Tax=Ferruginibacter sp. TaxID=1940288 RepID=UPI0026594DC8|nr:ThiF family adenylyltransferase [Ferruginibacter sp.]MDB5277129.1 sulfurtransferase [Ferruginibacter sp.]